MIAFGRSLRKHLTAFCVAVTLLTALAWLVSIFAVCSVAIHFSPKSTEVVAGITRSRIAIHFRDGFAQTTPGFHGEFLFAPHKTSDFLGEYYLEHFSGTVSAVGGITQASFVGIEFPLPCLVLVAAFTTYLVHHHFRFGLRFILVVVTVISIVATWYTAHPPNYLRS